MLRLFPELCWLSESEKAKSFGSLFLPTAILLFFLTGFFLFQVCRREKGVANRYEVLFDDGDESTVLSQDMKRPPFSGFVGQIDVLSQPVPNFNDAFAPTPPPLASAAPA